MTDEEILINKSFIFAILTDFISPVQYVGTS